MWYYNGEVFDNILGEFESFVYIIERLNTLEDPDSPIYYVGKKSFFFQVKTPKKPGTRSKIMRVESDWWDYYGSSEQLQADVARYGKYNFHRTILHLCRTRGDAGYLEAKEQINRNVLYTDPGGFRLYYNKNVLGQYLDPPEHYVLDTPISDYHNLESMMGFPGNRVWVSNGKDNRLITKSHAKQMTKVGGWCYGRTEKILEVNDGESNYSLPGSQVDPLRHRPGWLLEYVRDGQGTKLIPKHLLMPGMEVISRYVDQPTRGNPDKIKISMVKDGNLIWIPENEEEIYKDLGWLRKTPDMDYNLFFVTDGIAGKHFRTMEEKEEFLQKNKKWVGGKLTPKPLDSVYAKDIRTGKKILTTKEDLKNNKFLITMRTKEVKIKRGNRIIFQGYLKLFLLENPKYPESILKKALASETGDIIRDNEKLNIRWLC